jgi:hypothetical protein
VPESGRVESAPFFVSSSALDKENYENNQKPSLNLGNFNTAAASPCTIHFFQLGQHCANSRGRIQLASGFPCDLPDEQLQILFKRAVNNLNWQMKKEQEEKQRLEEALAK